MKDTPHAQQGILLAILAVAFFASYDTGAKFLSGSITVVMMLWTRYLLQVVWTAANHRRLQRERAWHTQRRVLHVVRAFSLLVCNVFAYFSFKHLPVANVTAIAMLTPLLLTVIAAWLFKEHVSPVQWVLVALGLVGTLLVAKPVDMVADVKLLLPLGFVLSYTGFQAITSRLVLTESPDTVMCYTSAVGFLALTAMLPLGWLAMPDLHGYLMLALVASCSAVGHHVLVLAYRRAPSSMLTPYLYFQLLFATLGGVLVFGERPDGLAILGGLMIAGSGIASAWARKAPITAPSTTEPTPRRA